MKLQPTLIKESDSTRLTRLETASQTQAEPVAWLVAKRQWVYFDKKRADDEAKFSAEPAQPLYIYTPEVLASQTQAEPVVWLVGKRQWVYFDKKQAECEAKFSGEPAQPLYTQPPEVQAWRTAEANIKRAIACGGTVHKGQVTLTLKELDAYTAELAQQVSRCQRHGG